MVAETTAAERRLRRRRHARDDVPARRRAAGARWSGVIDDDLGAGPVRPTTSSRWTPTPRHYTEDVDADRLRHPRQRHRPGAGPGRAARPRSRTSRTPRSATRPRPPRGATAVIDQVLGLVTVLLLLHRPDRAAGHHQHPGAVHRRADPRDRAAARGRHDPRAAALDGPRRGGPRRRRRGGGRPRPRTRAGARPPSPGWRPDTALVVSVPAGQLAAARRGRRRPGRAAPPACCPARRAARARRPHRDRHPVAGRRRGCATAQRWRNPRASSAPSRRRPPRQPGDSTGATPCRPPARWHPKPSSRSPPRSSP